MYTCTSNKIPINIYWYFIVNFILYIGGVAGEPGFDAIFL